MGKMRNERRIKAPLSRGVAKVPVIMQLEALECGAASLAMVMAYYDKWVPLEQVRRDCGVSRDGSKAANIVIVTAREGAAMDFEHVVSEVRRSFKPGF